MEQYPEMDALFLFIKVVEASSFAKVTRKYNIPKATLSRKIAQLEEHYSTQLLVRNTRHIQLTEIGREIFHKSHAILALIEETQTAVTKTKEAPHGLLRITAGVEYGLSMLSPLVNEFLKDHPEVNVELDLTGRRVDLIYEGFDLGVRIGPLEDSTLAMRKIGSFKYGLFCSPRFLKDHKKVTVENLVNLPTLGFSRVGNRKTWTLLNKLDEQSIEINPRLISNNYWALLNAAESGLGIVFMPMFLAQKSIEKNLIHQVLPQWHSEEIPVHFIYPSQKYLTSKVRSFVDFTIKKIGSTK
jgi:LysR family transcriptional regulator, regulator for bpeEF and oprC